MGQGEAPEDEVLNEWSPGQGGCLWVEVHAVAGSAGLRLALPLGRVTGGSEQGH